MRDQIVRVYLVDEEARRYSPSAEGGSTESDRPLSAELQPRETATARRVFTLPADAGRAGLVVERAAARPFRCLIVAGPCWFPPPAQPPVVLEE
jgi:hypothetical protein